MVSKSSFTAEAILATSLLSNSAPAGFNNWVLPSKDELVALYKSRKKLKNYKASDYWSSTTYAGDTTFAWDVYFGNGYDDVNNKSNSFYLRCVRTGQ